MTHLRNEGPIGVFDAGLGGLTVLSALQRRLPLEDFVYLADTARSPYGTRGRQTVLNYAHACARVLRDYRIKLLVLACSTSSAVALSSLGGELFVPTVGVIVPSLEEALATGATRIGVLTSAYLARSGDYTHTLSGLAGHAQLHVHKSQLLGALLDDGVWSGALAQLAVREHLAPLVAAGVQTVVLGESALTVWRGLIGAELAALSGRSIGVVDSAEPVAEAVAQLVDAKQLATARTDPGKLRLVFTDLPADMTIAQHYFGHPFTGISVTSVDL